MNPTSYRDTALYKLLNDSFPRLKRIEEALQDTSPAVVSGMLSQEPDLIFLIDYYFRLFDPSIGAGFVSHPEFALHSAVELFNCQVIRYYRANLDAAEHDFSYASLLVSYWSKVGKERVLQILKELILSSGSSNSFSAILLLQRMDAEALRFIQEDESFRTGAMLELFKNIGSGVESIISDNLDMFDFVYKLAVEKGDAEYMKFLDEYTNLVVQLRIAENLLGEAEKLLDDNGRLPLSQLVNFLQDLPTASRGLVVRLLKQKNYLEAGVLDGLTKLLESGRGK